MNKINRIIPLLVYKDIAAAHDFLVRAFGFDEGTVDRNADGQPVHGEVHAGDTTIWLHRVTADHGLDSPTITSGGLVVHVDDVDAHHQRASAAGARIQTEPQNQPYGQREYEARDPEGHRWWFATPVQQVPAP
jgi:uncharacterized glyoxalase superfamily protein PhnB